MALSDSPRPWILIAAMVSLALLTWMHPRHSGAGEIQVTPGEAVPDVSKPQQLKLVSGQAVVLNSPEKLTRVSEPDADVVEVEVLSPNEIYLTPRAAGTTNLILWHENKPATVYQLKVKYDLSRLKKRVHEMFPDETELRIMPTHDSITLSGRVSSSSSLDQILAVAESYAPEDKIRNLVQVGGVHQVMLEVKVAEMSRIVGRELGINFGYARGGDFAVTTLGGHSEVQWGDGDLRDFPDEFSIFPDSINALFRFHVGSASWTGILNALQEEGLAKILAEPSLVALSGQTASFLAGGEIPIPIVDQEGNVGVEWRSYGVELAFTPNVLSQDRIAVEVVPVVSDLDRARGTEIYGSHVPALNVRRANTTVELGDGQSFAIAGLLSETTEEITSKFPGLGDLPVLGPLFSSKSFHSNETELVILVTPRLARPIVARDQSLPTDYYLEPDDAEFYFWGVHGQSSSQGGTGVKGEFDGDFGHVRIK